MCILFFSNLITRFEVVFRDIKNDFGNFMLLTGFIFYFLWLMVMPIYKKYLELKLYDRIGSDTHIIDGMDGFLFEMYVASIFYEDNYHVKRTPPRGDFGADIILREKFMDKRRSGKRKKIVVQTKRYSSPVGISAIQEAYAAQGFYRADEAWVVTNSTFTKPATIMAHRLGVKLIDREKFLIMIDELNKKKRGS